MVGEVSCKLLNYIMIEKYYKLNELLNMIEEPNRDSCKKIYLENKAMFEKSKGSNVKHHAYEGGYLDHVRDTMNVAVRLHDSLNSCRQLPFSLSDSLLVLFLHDLEKPWKYAGTEEQKKELSSCLDYQNFIKSKLDEYGFRLKNAHWNSLIYVHGEGDDYSPKVNIQSPLAAFVHCCDNISARIWFDGAKEKDSW